MAEPIAVYKEAFDLYKQIQDAGATSKTDALRLPSGSYDKAAWDELRSLGLVLNAAGAGLRYVDLYVNPEKRVPLRSRGPRPRRYRIPDSRRVGARPTPRPRPTIKDLSRFAGRAEELLSRLTTERRQQAAQRVKEAQSAVGSASPADLKAAMKSLDEALKAHDDVESAVQVEVLAQLKPDRSSAEWAIWSVLSGQAE